MKKIRFLLLALFPLLAGCALFGTKDEYRVTPKLFRLESLLEDLDRANNPEAEKEPVTQVAPKSWAGKYLLKVNTLSGGDNYMAGNCDESALVDVDKDRKIIDVKAFPSSAKTCGSEESLKTTFWGKVVPAGLLASGYVGGSAVLGMSFPKPQGDRIDLSNDSSSKSEAEAEGGSGGKSVIEKGAVANNLTANPTAYGGEGGKGGTGGQGGVANAQGGKAIGGSIQPGAVQVTAQGGKAEIENSGNSKLENKTGPISVTASPSATAEGAKIIGSGNSSSHSYSKGEGGKVSGSGNSTNFNSSGSYSNSDSSAANYNSNYNKNISPVDIEVDVKVQPGQSGGKHCNHGCGKDW